MIGDEAPDRGSDAVRPGRFRLRGVHVMSGQPYSDKAWKAARAACYCPFTVSSLDAAHDREALGLDASVCARTFLNEIRAKLREHRAMGEDYVTFPDALLPADEFIRRQFGEQA